MDAHLNFTEVKNNNVVTDISQLKIYMEGNVVKLPDFGEGQPFYARLRRPSLLSLIKEGKIPNALMNSANELFVSGSSAMVENVNSEEKMKEIFEVIDVLCEATFVSPKYSEMKANGITLTDEQYMFIFAYTQDGIKALENFR